MNESLLTLIKGWVWSPVLLFLLLGVGVYLTWVLRGVQFRYLGYGLRLAFTPDRDNNQGDISRFEALMTSLAGAIGTGNIVGIATAITIGGMGSIFWMWITALLGMATKYAEAVLAVRYREKDERGEMSGGPMYYIQSGMGRNWRWMAVLFAFFGTFAAIGTGNLVQVNSIADVLVDRWEINPWLTGVVLAGLTGVVLLGGVRSIGHVTGVLVPAMAVLYICGGMAIIFLYLDQVIPTLQLIVTSAFTGQAAVGGFTGSTLMLAVQMGVSRGVFSNESGLGISSIAAAAAKTDCPGRQAMVAMTGTFLSTLVVCTITGLVLGVTGVFGELNGDGATLNGAPMAVAAFDRGFSGGGYVATLSLILFAFSTVVGWAYYGEKCAEFLFGERCIPLYRVLYSLVIIPGSAINLELVWGFADIMNGLMVYPNLIALLMLSGVLVNETLAFEKKVLSEK